MASRSGLLRFLPTLAFCAVVTAIGGEFRTISDVPAGKPFSYVPPDTFHPISLPANLNADDSVERLWVEPTAVSKLDPRITLSHTTQVPQVDEGTLRIIVSGMPALYEKSHGTWTEERHVVHVRPDGARVGLIVGDLVTADEVHLMTMQMIFPDDTGTSIATASFDQVSSERLVPQLEKSLDVADGVKKLGKKPENNVYIAWFFGALIFAVGAQAIFRSLRKSKS
jgi:hypothetical protein